MLPPVLEQLLRRLPCIILFDPKNKKTLTLDFFGNIVGVDRAKRSLWQSDVLDMDRVVKYSVKIAKIPETNVIAHYIFDEVKNDPVDSLENATEFLARLDLIFGKPQFGENTAVFDLWFDKAIQEVGVGAKKSPIN
jgi:hypothetical protein